MPGFAATTEGDHGVITLTLRGVGNDSAKTEYADPEVALFVDGVYTPRAEAAAGLLLDLDSVEVLRGPQGTLWGRNSTVGAVNFQTAKAELGSDIHGYAQMEAGSYNHVGERAAVNVPVSDTFAFRVAVAHEEHDGYVISRARTDSCRRWPASRRRSRPAAAIRRTSSRSIRTSMSKAGRNTTHRIRPQRASARCGRRAIASAGISRSNISATAAP